MTRGERNNNPLNLDYIPPPRNFLGQVGIEIIPPGLDETPRFGRYDTPEHGVRAGAEQVLIDCYRDGLGTIRKLVATPGLGWAPESDGNDTAAYIAALVDATGLAADDPLNLRDATIHDALITAMIREENGAVPYARDLIANACASAREAFFHTV